MKYQYDDNNAELIKQIIESSLNIKVNDIKLIGNGNDSYVYEVDNIIFKFSRHEKASENLKKEINILKFLEGKLTLQIPKVLYVGEPNEIFPYYFCGQSKIEGVPLSPEIYEELSLEDEEQLAKDLANFLHELHHIPFNEYRENTIDNFKKDYEKLKELVYDKLDEITKQKIDNMYMELFNNSDFLNCENSLIHNDFSCNNIMFNPNTKRVSGIIDFGDACVSDLDNDFYCLLEDSDEELGISFGLKVLKNYGCNDIERMFRKSFFHEKYWCIEQILYGYEYGYQNWIEEGLIALKDQMSFYDIETPTRLMNFMNANIKYGWVDKQGDKHFNNLEGFRENYRISTIDEMLETGLGTCIEQAKMIKFFFDKIGLENKLYCHRSYETEENFDKEVRMHCFVLFKYNDCWYHFEHSNRPKRGIHKYESLEKAIEEITSGYEEGDIRKLTEIDSIPDGLSFKEFNQFVNEFDNIKSNVL